jgi:hypothetical protein
MIKTGLEALDMSGSQIDWTASQKYLVISPTTWDIKSKEDRLSAAKEDLRRAGYTADAELLNHNRLNTAFYKLPEETRAKYVGERSLAKSHKRAAPETQRAQRREGLIF